MAVRRPALRYYGSKWRLAPEIIALFPPHVCFCEPFGGSATILLQKPPSAIEVYNDLDCLVVNFFRVLRERPDELVRLIELTPYSRRELEEAVRYECEDELELARCLFIQSWQSWAGACGGRGVSWRYDRARPAHKPVVKAWSDVEHLHAVAKRLKGVQIECDDAFRVIERFDAPTTLFYLDPPYLLGSRSTGGRNGYRHELTREDHVRLAGALRDLEGMAIVSSYENEVYAELLGDWQRVEKRARTERGRFAVEVLWISPGCDAARLPLFAGE